MGWLSGLIVAVALIALLFLATRSALPANGEAVNYAFVLLIGATVGATELMSRYRDAPFKPLKSVSGALYMVINGGAAILAYYLLGVLAGPLSANPVKASVYQVLVAGLSAMAFFRSGLFTIRLGDSDVAVGPNLVLQILLNALDRTYDRIRAAPRSECAAAIMAGIDFDLAKEALPSFCLNLMQNVSQGEKLAVATEVKALAEAQGMSNEAKALNLGLTMLNVVGEKTLESAVNALGGTIRASKPLGVTLLAGLVKLPANRALSLLPVLVHVLSDAPTRDAELKQLQELMALNMSDDDKVPLVARVLVRYYGEAVVSSAVASLAAGLAPPPPPSPLPTPPPPAG